MKLKKVNKQLVDASFWYYLGYASGPHYGMLYSNKIYRPHNEIITYKKPSGSEQLLDLVNYLMYENIILTCAPRNYIIIEAI